MWIKPQSFKEFMEQNPGLSSQPEVKPWKAKKEEILRHWSGLQPNMPITMKAVSEHHKGTRFNYDGIRITGSTEFINSVMSRLKDLMKYEGEAQRLDVEYRQGTNKSGDPNEMPVYVFYCHLVKDEDQLNPKV